MKLLMHFLESPIREMCINLRGRNAGVAKHFLDRADVGAVDEEFGGERMAESVGGDAFDDAGFQGCAADDGFDTDCRETTGFAEGDVGAFLAAFVIEEYWIETVETGGKIFF